MDTRDSEANRTGDSAEPANHQSEFDFAADRENQRRAWENLGRMEAGLQLIEDGIQLAQGYDRSARNYLEQLERHEPELEQETGRSEREVELLGDAGNAQQQSRQPNDRDQNAGYQRQQSEKELDL